MSTLAKKLDESIRREDGAIKPEALASIPLLDRAVIDKLYKEHKEMKEYFSFIEKFSRQDLILLLKWEIYNRVFTEKDAS